MESYSIESGKKTGRICSQNLLEWERNWEEREDSQVSDAESDFDE